jgi:homocysteine S-methyltransferase
LAEAKRRGVGFVLDTPTWRASPDWAEKIGFSRDEVLQANRRAASFMAQLRETLGDPSIPVVLNGVVGPRGDGYVVGVTMTGEEAERYHRPQIDALRDGGVDMVSAITMTYIEEALGIARAARSCGLPVVISFTVETDGRLPSGQSLRAAIEETDATTEGAPAYYMINCAHPDHFRHVLTGGGEWLSRIVGIRANASRQSHTELDAATELDIGDPAQLGQQYRELRDQLPRLNVFGGCCGTDHRHLRAISEACI